MYVVMTILDTFPIIPALVGQRFLAPAARGPRPCATNLAFSSVLFPHAPPSSLLPQESFSFTVQDSGAEGIMYKDIEDE